MQHSSLTNKTYPAASLAPVAVLYIPFYQTDISKTGKRRKIGYLGLENKYEKAPKEAFFRRK